MRGTITTTKRDDKKRQPKNGDDWKSRIVNRQMAPGRIKKKRA
jgi:hypothetical protein